MLPPLKQFVCDTCDEIIKSPEDGWLEWIHDREAKKSRAFRICHHVTSSPRGQPEGCYTHTNEPGCSDMHLDSILEVKSAFLLHFVDLGQYHQHEYAGPAVFDLREWTELARRLTIPYYEEARQYWNEAIHDGYFDGANEIMVYTEGFLKKLVEKYASR